jgi:DNA-binding MarR family transcriptional regulator
MDDVVPSTFTLDRQLCFALTSASRAISNCYRPFLEQIGLTYTQYVVMLVLWEHRSVSQSYLNDCTQLDSGTLSPLLKRLQNRGLISRQRAEQDERTVQISLTPAGAALWEDAFHAQARVEGATGLTTDELARLRDELRALSLRLRTAHTGSPTTH